MTPVPFREDTWGALRRQLAASPHWVAAELDRDLRVTACSQGFLRLLGREAVAPGTPLGALLVADGSAPPGLPAPGEGRRLRVTFAAAGGTSQVLTCTLSGTPEGCALAGETALLTHDAMVARMSSLQDELANTNRELQQKIRELEQARDKIRTLRGLLPICCSCKKIRDDRGYWNQVESYISQRTEAEFSHGICPDCAHRLYPEFRGPPPPGLPE